MATVKTLYDTSGLVTFTSLSGLAASTTLGTGAESGVIDNSTTLYDRVRLRGRFCLGTGTIANDQAVYVFMYPIVPDASGNDTAVGYNRIPQMTDQTLPRTSPAPTAAFPENMPGVQLVAAVPATVAGTALDWSALLQFPPRKFGLFVRNNCGVPLSGAPTTWAATTAYAKGAVVTPVTPNGHLYLCIANGTSAGSAPTWPTNGNTVADGTVTWLDLGTVSTVANWILYQGEYDQLV